MKWFFTWRVKPPTGCVISARNGGSVFFAAYSSILRRWYHVIPGHGEELISEPQMLFLDEDYARTHAKDLSKGRRPSVRLREGKKKLVQYELAI